MNVYFLGEYIKKQREKLGLTQEQVCEGICEQVTLSRLENGSKPQAGQESMHFYNVLGCRKTAII